MIVFQDQNEFPIKNMKEIDKTVSTLLIPEHLVEKFLQKRLEGHGNNTSVYLRNLLSMYRIITHSGMIPKPSKIKTEYQEENQNLKRVSFRPDNSDWIELGQLAIAFGKSRCWMFTFLLSLDLAGIWEILSESSLGLAVPTSPSLELMSYLILERFFHNFVRGYYIKV